jgi:hypothetical protein
MSHTPTEQRRLGQVADDYRAKGYQVIVAPSREQMPPWLGGHTADLLALHEEDKVVVEIKSPAKLRHDPALSALARVVEEQPGWRLELVVPGRPKRKAPSLPGQVLEPGYAAEQTDVARKLLSRGLVIPAFIIAWAAFEIAFRNAFRLAEIDPHTSDVQTVLKTLLSLGYFASVDEMRRMQLVWELRNRVIHGYSAHLELNTETIEFVLGITERLLSVEYRP